MIFTHPPHHKLSHFLTPLPAMVMMYFMNGPLSDWHKIICYGLVKHNNSKRNKKIMML